MSKRYYYILCVLIGIISYMISLFSPLLSISEFYIFRDTLTIISITLVLLNSGEWLLFLTIVIFAFLLPSLKYILLFIYGIFPEKLSPSNRTLIVLEVISKWAMLDVFIIAFLIAGIKLKSLAGAQSHYGLYLFVTAVIIAMGCSYYSKTFLYKDK